MEISLDYLSIEIIPIPSEEYAEVMVRAKVNGEIVGYRRMVMADNHFVTFFDRIIDFAAHEIKHIVEEKYGKK